MITYADDKEREGRPQKFQEAKLKDILDQDSCQTYEHLAKSVTQAAIASRSKALGHHKGTYFFKS